MPTTTVREAVEQFLGKKGKAVADANKAKKLDQLAKDVDAYEPPDAPTDKYQVVIQTTKPPGNGWTEFKKLMDAEYWKPYEEIRKKEKRELDWDVECELLWQLLVVALAEPNQATAKEAVGLLFDLCADMGMKPLESKGPRIFWSGETSKAAALADHGKWGEDEFFSLEGSDIGKLLDKMNKSLIWQMPKANQNVLWGVVSDRFGAGATKTCHVYVDKGFTLHNVFFNVELPGLRELQGKGVVDDIMVHIWDPTLEGGKGGWLAAFSIDATKDGKQRLLAIDMDRWGSKQVDKEKNLWENRKFAKPLDAKKFERIFDQFLDGRKLMTSANKERGALIGRPLLTKFGCLTGDRFGKGEPIFANLTRHSNKLGRMTVNLIQYESPIEKKIFFDELSSHEVFQICDSFMEDWLTKNVKDWNDLPDAGIRYFEDVLIYQDSGDKVPRIHCVRMTGGCTGAYEVGWPPYKGNDKDVHTGCAKCKDNKAYTDKEIVEQIKKATPDFAKSATFQKDLDALLDAPDKLANAELKKNIEKLRELLTP